MGSEVRSSDEHPYWINIKTGESSWENPNGTDGTEAIITEVGQIAQASEGYEYTEHDTLGEREAEETNYLCDDTWERHYDPDLDWYYYTIRQRGKQNGTILQRNMELMSINMVTTSSMEMKIATLVSKICRTRQ